MFHLPMKLLLGSNLSQREKQRENKLVGENNYSFKAVPLITFNLLRIEGEAPINTTESSIITFTHQLLRMNVPHTQGYHQLSSWLSILAVHHRKLCNLKLLKISPFGCFMEFSQQY